MEQRSSKPLPVNQLAFEQAAMEQICTRSALSGDIIRKQYVAATMVGRWGSGKGLFTDFAVSDGAVPVPTDKRDPTGYAFFDIEGVDSETARTHDGCNLVMCQLEFSDGGLIRFIECFNFGGSWPTEFYVWRESEHHAVPRSLNG